MLYQCCKNIVCYITSFIWIGFHTYIIIANPFIFPPSYSRHEHIILLITKQLLTFIYKHWLVRLDDMSIFFHFLWFDYEKNDNWQYNKSWIGKTVFNGSLPGLMKNSIFFYIKIIIRIYYYGDCPVENLNLYVEKDAGSGTSFSGTRSGIVLTLEFSVVSTHVETILRKKIETTPISTIFFDWYFIKTQISKNKPQNSPFFLWSLFVFFWSLVFFLRSVVFM